MFSLITNKLTINGDFLKSENLHYDTIMTNNCHGGLFYENFIQRHDREILFKSSKSIRSNSMELLITKRGLNFVEKFYRWKKYRK